MKGVAFLGDKGGVGKTSLAHALALGAAWKGVPGYLMHTDNREPLKVNGRPYAYYDARDPKDLETLIKTALNNDGLFIVDGGGNRPEFDKWIAASMDLVLVPFIPDEEAINTNLAHMKRLERAGANVWAIVNAYPGSRFERQYVDRELLKDLPQDRILARVPEVKAVRTLRASDKPVFKTPPTRVNDLSRKLYLTVNQALLAIDRAAEPTRLSA